ncbi:hypothetical protein F4604DRAFT_1973919 [Suillus subluteus]|nr:hypothetical protein F4604DRAFT_1973919 [Suillus subluteus]
MNTPARNHQQVHTLVDMMQIQQWHMYDPEKITERRQPDVAFFITESNPKFRILCIDLDEVVDTSDVEEREFDISEADYYTCFSPTEKTRLNSGPATKLHGRFNDRQEGQPSPRKRVKTTQSESESQLIVDLSSLPHALPVKSTTSSALRASGTHSPMRVAFNPASNLSLPAADAHEASLHNETRSTDVQEPDFNVLGILSSLILAESGNLSHHPITSADGQQQADPQSPLPDSSQPQLDDAHPPPL